MHSRSSSLRLPALTAQGHRRAKSLASPRVPQFFQLDASLVADQKMAYLLRGAQAVLHRHTDLNTALVESSDLNTAYDKLLSRYNKYQSEFQVTNPNSYKLTRCDKLHFAIEAFYRELHRYLRDAVAELGRSIPAFSPTHVRNYADLRAAITQTKVSLADTNQQLADVPADAIERLSKIITVTANTNWHLARLSKLRTSVLDDTRRRSELLTILCQSNNNPIKDCFLFLVNATEGINQFVEYMQSTHIKSLKECFYKDDPKAQRKKAKLYFRDENYKMLAKHVLKEQQRVLITLSEKLECYWNTVLLRHQLQPSVDVFARQSQDGEIRVYAHQLYQSLRANALQCYEESLRLLAKLDKPGTPHGQDSACHIARINLMQIIIEFQQIECGVLINQQVSVFELLRLRFLLQCHGDQLRCRMDHVNLVGPDYLIEPTTGIFHWFSY